MIQSVFLQGTLLVQKVKIKPEGLSTRCEMQSSPCVFSSSSTSLLKIYQTYRSWISSTIKMHEIKTSRFTALRNCQPKKLDFFFPNNVNFPLCYTIFYLRGIQNRCSRSTAPYRNVYHKIAHRGFCSKDLVFFFIYFLL